MLMKYFGILTPTKDLVNKHLGMMRIDLKKNFTIMKRLVLDKGMKNNE